MKNSEKLQYIIQILKMDRDVQLQYLNQMLKDLEEILEFHKDLEKEYSPTVKFTPLFTRCPSTNQNGVQCGYILNEEGEHLPHSKTNHHGLGDMAAWNDKDIE